MLDLAVLGKTDEQIAQELSMSTSTVNSYWGRIRGKSARIVETELVGKVLRHESNLRYADLLAENERLKRGEQDLRKDLVATERELASTERDLRNERGAIWHLHALDHVSDATLVCRPSGEIVYANLHAEHLFAAEPGELEKLQVWELAIPEDEETKPHAATVFFESSSAPRAVVGVEGPCTLAGETERVSER